MYTTWYKNGNVLGSRGRWRNIGGNFGAGAKVTVLARSGDKLDLFVCDSKGDVYTTWWHRRWIGSDWAHLNCQWDKIGTGFDGESDVVAVGRGRNIDLFICDQSGLVRTSRGATGSAWPPTNGWRSLRAPFSPGSKLAAVARSTDRMDLFICEPDGSIQAVKWRDNKWSDALLIGSIFDGGEITAMVMYGYLYVFVCDQDGCLFTAQWTEDSEQTKPDGWTQLNNHFYAVGEVKGFENSSGEQVIFVHDSNHKIRTGKWKDDPKQVEWELIDDAPPAWTELAAASGRPGAGGDLFAWFVDGRNHSLRWKGQQDLAWQDWQIIWRP